MEFAKTKLLPGQSNFLLVPKDDTPSYTAKARGKNRRKASKKSVKSKILNLGKRTDIGAKGYKKL